MESLLRKKILICLVFLSAFFLYVSIRIKSKLESLRSFVNYRFDNGGPVDLMKQCSDLGTVLINIEKGLGPETFEKNAKYLFNTNFGYENVCKTKKIDICTTENCALVDIKYFILQYFRELVKRGVILRNRHDQIFNFVIYDIFPDKAELGDDTKETKEFEEGLKTFGMMIGLVIIHRVYLEMRFESHFLRNVSDAEDLLDTLKSIDSEQYEIYNSLRYSYGQKKSKFVPKSQKPFRNAYDPDPLAVEYNSYQYPFHQAGQQIFFDPYRKSRSLIFEGISKVCSFVYYNSEKKFYNRDYHYEVNLNFITKKSSSKNPTSYDIKDNIDNDKNSRLFLKALRHLDNNEGYLVYQKITNFQYIPADGLSRLPRIKVVSGHSEKIFPKPFLIVIEPGIDEYELVKKIRYDINNK